MSAVPLRLWSYLAVDSAILAVCLLHIPSLVHRATTPFELGVDKGRIVVERVVDRRASADVREGDAVIRWQGGELPRPEAAEFLCDLSSIGDSVVITFEREGILHDVLVKLVPFYPSPRYVIITTFVGLTIWGLGIYVLWAGWRTLVGRVLHWVMMSFSAVVMLTWGAVSPGFTETVARPLLFLLAYEIGVPFFFFFSVLYPLKKSGPMPLILTFIFLPAIVSLGSSWYFYQGALFARSVPQFDSFQSVYDVFHASMLFYIGGGLINFVHSYVTSRSYADRQQLRWILWGFAVGAVPFMLLYILPQLIFSGYFIHEEYTTIFFLVIPFSLALSFIRYPLPSIDVVINRSIVYAVLSIFIAAAYVLAVLLITSIIGGEIVFEQYLFIVAVTLVVGFMMNPLRRRIQRYVDVTLFAARADFRRAMTETTANLHSVLSTEQLYGLIADSVARIVPAESVAAYSLHGTMLRLEAHSGSLPLSEILLTKQGAATLTSSRILALPESVSFSDDVIDFSQRSLLRESGFSIFLLMKTEAGELLSAIGLRTRSAAEKYDRHELEFLATLSAQAAEVLERLLLQERLLLERDAKRRSEELNALKSEIVSFVSHEFRTPLTSIKMFSDLLRRRLPGRNAKASEYLTIIDGESDRLNRMVTNLLDAARIEKGAKEYFPKEIDLCEVLRGVLHAMKYQLEKCQCTLISKIPATAMIIHADEDAVAQAIINLLTNAMKYSSKEKYINIEVKRKGKFILLSVTDRGDGIAKDALPLLFQKFYREPSHRGIVQGIGLGLPLVRHIMEAHNGRVDVRSTLGKGSTFKLSFPAVKQ